MTDVDLAMCKEIAELLKWDYYDNVGDADGPFIVGDDGYFTYTLDRDGVWAFIRAVEERLTEQQRVAYGDVLLTLLPILVRSDDGAVIRPLWTGAEAWLLATAPASVRLQSLKEALGSPC